MNKKKKIITYELSNGKIFSQTIEMIKEGRKIVIKRFLDNDGNVERVECSSLPYKGEEVRSCMENES